jgi:hypothetical protein
LRIAASSLPARQADDSAGASSRARRARSTFRISRHLERRQEIAHPGALDLRATPPQHRQGVACDDGQFHGHGAAEPVHQQRHAGPGRQLEIGEDRSMQTLNHGIGRQQGRAFDALLAMDAETELDFRRAKIEAGTADGRHRAGAQRHAHGAEIDGGGAGECRHLGETLARGRGRAGHLVDKQRTRNAAPAIARHGVAQRHIVGHDDDLDRNAIRACQLGGEAEIQPVAGIVLDHQHRAGRAGGGTDAGQHGVDAGRGEDIPRDRRREQPRADIACMGSFMP